MVQPEDVLQIFAVVDFRRFLLQNTEVVICFEGDCRLKYAVRHV